MPALALNSTAVVLRETDSLGNFFRVVRLANIIPTSFDIEGLLIGFIEKKTKIEYIYLDRKNLTTNDYAIDERNNIEAGFYSKDEFLDYYYESHDVLIDTYIKDILNTRFTDFIEPEEEDDILLIRTKVTYTIEEYYTDEVFIFYYNSEQPFKLDNYGRVDLEFGVWLQDGTKVPNMYDLGLTFYTYNLRFVNDADINEHEKFLRGYALIRIALSISSVDNNIFPLLSQNEDVQKLILKQRNYWSLGEGIFDDPKTEEIVMYANRIGSFRLSGISDQLKIKSETGMNSLYRLVSTVNYYTLSILTLELRIDLLQRIAKFKLLDEVLYTWEPIDFEHIVRNIVLSVSSVDADEFLDALLEIKPPENITLFQYIFDETNDIGYSKDALKYIMEHLCTLWLDSKYSYYSSGTPVFPNASSGEPKLIDVINFMIQDSTNYNEESVSNGQYTNKPIEFDYECKEFLLLFNETNYDFIFDGNRILAAKNAPKLSALIYTGYTSYHMYQGVTLTTSDDTAEELKIQFPKIVVNGKESSIIPIFYLAYFDYNKYIDNVVVGVQVTLDLLLTISGIGNLLKLRHLFTLTKLGRMLMTAEGISVTDVIVYRVGTATIEIGSTVAYHYVNYMTTGHNNYCEPGPNYNELKCQWYQDFANWLLLIQLKSGVIDGAHRLITQKAARKLMNNLDNAPESFLEEHILVIRTFAEYDYNELELIFKDYLVNSLNHSNISFVESSAFWVKFLELTEANKLRFIYNFERATPLTLKTLYLDDDLITCWTEIAYLKNFRKNVKFLESYRVIKNSDELDEEIFIGRGYGELKTEYLNTPGPHPDNHYTWDAKGGHHIAATEGIDARVRYKELDSGNNPIKYPLGPNGLGYYEARLQIKCEGLIQNDGWKSKGSKRGGMATFFPDHWTPQKVREEIAFAFTNKEQTKLSTAFIGTMSDGVSLKIFIQNGIITTAFPYFKLKK